MADAPTPAMARPTMSMGDDVAAAHMTDPTSKMSSAVRYVIFMSKFAYIFPKEGCREVIVSRYDEPYQPTSFRESNTVVMVGIAVADGKKY